MDNLMAKAGQFWLNDQPLFIHAGEFHYFRTPQDQWRQRLGLLIAAGFNTLATYIPWIWHQVDEDVSDFDGHSHPLRNLEGFLDLAAELGLWIIPRPGPYIMAETINEGIPPWVFSKYPQSAYINQDNTVQNIASYLHPDFLACVSGWYREIFKVLTPRQVSRNGKIIMVQLDNEMGMAQWVRNMMDINPDTISKFTAFVNDTYGDRRKERYPVQHLEDALREGILHPTEAFAEKIVVDYRLFFRKYIWEYTAFLWAEAKANGLEVLPVINIHGFANGGKTFPIGLSQLIQAIEMEGMVSATDVYPLMIGEGNFHQMLMVNEMTKALQNKEQSLFSIEFQSGGNNDFSNSQSSMYDLHSRLCISSGMRAINHYSFFAGENHPALSPVKRHDWGPPVRNDGTVRQHYFRYPKLSKVLASYGPDLILSSPQTVTTIGFLLDYFMTEVNNQFTREPTRILTHQREVVLFDMIARGLSLTHRPFKTLELTRCSLDPYRTPVCWVMMDKQCDGITQRKLADYVLDGGNLILAGRMCSQDFKQAVCTILQDTIGIKQVNSDLPFQSSTIHAFQYPDVPVSFVESYSGEFDEHFATTEKGGICGLINQVGKGVVMVFGAAMPVETLVELDIVHQMAMRMGCLPLFELSNWADVRLSRAEKGSFLFINNYQDDPVETTIKYQGDFLFGGNPVSLPARKGAILPVNWQLNEEVLIHYATSEIIDITEAGHVITLKTDQKDLLAEISLAGYHCDQATTIDQSGTTRRVILHSIDGSIVLRKASKF